MGEKFVLKPPSADGEGDWQAIPDQSSLNARLLGVQTKEMPFKDKETGAPVFKVEWTFEIQDDGPFFHRKVKGSTSTNFNNHPDCRMYQWVKILHGNQNLPEGYELDVDDLLGVDCVVQVNAKESPKKDGSGGVWVNNNVIDVRPARDSVSVGGSNKYDDEPF